MSWNKAFFWLLLSTLFDFCCCHVEIWWWWWFLFRLVKARRTATITTPPSGWETRRSGLLVQQGLKKTQCLLRRQTYKPCTESMRKVSRCPWCPVSVSQTREDPRAHGRQTQQTKPEASLGFFPFSILLLFIPTFLNQSSLYLLG